MAKLSKVFFLRYLAISFLFLVACNDDDNIGNKPGTEGFYVVNEGGFGNGNSSISFFDKQTNQVVNDVFKFVNYRSLGDQSQSMTVFNDKGYIVVQGSGKVEVINTTDNKSIATIEDGIESPRYFVGASNSKGFVSDWGIDGVSGTVKVLDLNTNTVVKSIPVGKGPNRMMLNDDLLYVANGGGYDYDNTVVVININSEDVVFTYTVGDNPNSIQMDNTGAIWVASSGRTVYNEDYSVNEEESTTGSLSKIVGGAEVLRLTAPELGGLGSLDRSPDSKTLYFLYLDGIYTITMSATQFPTKAFVTKPYYGIAVNPSDGMIIGCLAPNFSSAGSIEILDENGVSQGNYTVGIGPNGCAFK
ncbi:MAG: DUF5074 domain-containing protein [Chryseolinea sp.]